MLLSRLLDMTLTEAFATRAAGEMFQAILLALGLN
jgi:hypothetical protein